MGGSHSEDPAENGAQVSVRREWTVNYGRYCPPVNNIPPHYMWELLTSDRLGATLHLSLFLSLPPALHVCTQYNTVSRAVLSPPLYLTLDLVSSRVR